LIELLVAISILAILATIAMPSFQQIFRENRLATATNELVASLHLARMEAIKRGRRVVICESDGGRTCTEGGDWARGWIIFADANGDGQFNDDGDQTPCEAGEDCLIFVREPFQERLTIHFNRGSRLIYLPSGRIRGFVGGTFILCTQERGDYGREVVLNAMGRVRLEKGFQCPAQ